MSQSLSCIECGSVFSLSEIRYRCDCGGLLEVKQPQTAFEKIGPKDFDQRLLSRKPIDVSGVWRFRELLLDCLEDEIISHPEGGTHLYKRNRFSEFSGVDDIYLKHEGENPTGSFKDRGMTCAITQAKRLGVRSVGCASTGNTSASLAAYAAQAGLSAAVFLPAGKVAAGKLSQAIGFGARCLSLKGDFDDAMKMVKVLAEGGDLYMVNSLNPFRLEGQKTVMWEMLQNLSWQSPDWVVVPGGNLGNTSAFGKGLKEAYNAGWISKLPRIATIQASGANPFFRSFNSSFKDYSPIKAETVATAVRIGDPVNYKKARRVIEDLDGVVCEVSDTEILAAKSIIDSQGVGCEPASASSLAGVKKLVTEGTIKKSDSVVAILTGHMLKDTEAIMACTGNKLIDAEANIASVKKFLDL